MGETTNIQKGKVSAKRNSEARREQNRLASRNYRPSVSSDTGAPPLQDQTLSSAPLTNHLIPLDLNRFDGNSTYFVPQTWEDFTQETVPTAISNQLVPELLPVFNKGNPPSLGSHDQWEAAMPGLIQQSSTFAGQTRADYMGYRAIEEVLEDVPQSDHGGSQGASSTDDSSLKDVLHGVESLSIEQKRYKFTTRYPRTEISVFVAKDTASDSWSNSSYTICQSIVQGSKCETIAFPSTILDGAGDIWCNIRKLLRSRYGRCRRDTP
ncbi:hypothetical protein FGADI_4510 [Fusarium gaditjirri]|uniref:BZIP domain-containing protein n=1 Tax=Fusarium gaditjirri TaxID=282569 RepID=A0A8H4TCW3_9HYPO|nr:hypothetical protein FGADI_4510 [Fusarium gaditjirri]